MALTREQFIEDLHAISAKSKSKFNREIIDRFINDSLVYYEDSMLESYRFQLNKIVNIFGSSSISNFKIDEIIYLITEGNHQQNKLMYRLFQYVFDKDANKDMKHNKNKCLFMKGTFYEYEIFYSLRNKMITLDNLVFRKYKNTVTLQTIIGTYAVTSNNAYTNGLLSEFFLSEQNTSFKVNGLETLSKYLDKADFSLGTFGDDDIYKISKHFEDMNYETFQQMKAFILWCMSKFNESEKKKRFKHYKQSLVLGVTYRKFFKLGYRPFFYNIFDNVPDANNWWLYPNGEENRSTILNSDSVISVGFSDIKNHYLIPYVKDYFWHTPQINILTKSKDIRKVKMFLNMYYPNNAVINMVDPAICASYKSYVLTSHSKTETRNNYIYPVLSFIKYLDESSDIEIDKSSYFYLNNKGSLNTNGAKGLKRDDLQLLEQTMNKHKYDTFEDLAFYTMFHICLNTEFRVSQIAGLSINCIQPAMKVNEYVIRSISKVSYGKEMDIPCALVLKRIIDEYLVATSELREECTDQTIKKNLFFSYNKYKNFYRSLKGAKFSAILKKRCEEVSIPIYTAKNLRVTYLTNAKELIIREGKSDAYMLGLSGHRNIDTSNNHYIEEKIRDALEATNNTIIGNVNVNGQIIKFESTINRSKVVTVEKECGYCQSDFCDLNGPLSCLLCKHFATTIDRIPFFESQIEILNNMISSAESHHDIEDCVNLKRLFLRYVEELIKAKAELNYANRS